MGWRGKGGGKGEEKFCRYTSKCDTGTHNNGGLAFLDRKLDSQFLPTIFIVFSAPPCRGNWLSGWSRCKRNKSAGVASVFTASII